MYDVNDTTDPAQSSSDHLLVQSRGTQTQMLIVNLGMAVALREPSTVKRREQRLSRCIPRIGGAEEEGSGE
jgi:hypothetical protein